MLFDLCALLGPNGKGNGDLSAAPGPMRARGWGSTATRTAALRELQVAKLLVVTRQGGRRLCTLYAITLWPLQCDMNKLDAGPGAFSTRDWEGVGATLAQPPTADSPAQWRAVRKNANACPVAGQPPTSFAPVAGQPSPKPAPL
jgi:hypothetical protein